MRIRNNPDAPRKLIESGYQITEFPFKVDMNTIIELGMGKGEMITMLAQANHDKFYIGVEKFATVAEKAARKAKEMKLKNFKIICADIKDLPMFFDGKVKTLWLTFSDPWPKKYQAKRRLTFKSFLELYKQVLDEDGVIRFKTDNDFLFNWSVDHMTENGVELSNVTHDFHAHEASKDNIMTGYEIKWSSLGKKINYLEARFR